jgi:hypothetical protein
VHHEEPAEVEVVAEAAAEDQVAPEEDHVFQDFYPTN